VKKHNSLLGCQAGTGNRKNMTFRKQGDPPKKKKRGEEARENSKARGGPENAVLNEKKSPCQQGSCAEQLKKHKKEKFKGKTFKGRWKGKRPETSGEN